MRFGTEVYVCVNREGYLRSLLVVVVAIADLHGLRISLALVYMRSNNTMLDCCTTY